MCLQTAINEHRSKLINVYPVVNYRQRTDRGIFPMKEQAEDYYQPQLRETPMTEEQLFTEICDQLLHEGLHKESRIEDIAHYIMDNPDLYPNYFKWA